MMKYASYIKIYAARNNPSSQKAKGFTMIKFGLVDTRSALHRQLLENLE